MTCSIYIFRLLVWLVFTIAALNLLYLSEIDLLMFIVTG